MGGMQSKADRLAMIREAAKKFEAKQARKTAGVIKPPKEEDDERLWTDASKYAAEHYGETFHGTTRFDNDWG